MIKTFLPNQGYTVGIGNHNGVLLTERVRLNSQSIESEGTVGRCGATRKSYNARKFRKKWLERIGV